MAQRAITLSDIKSADWSLMLDSAGQPGSGIGGVVMGVDDVDQCIAIILTTPRVQTFCALPSALISGNISTRR